MKKPPSTSGTARTVTEEEAARMTKPTAAKSGTKSGTITPVAPLPKQGPANSTGGYPSSSGLGTSQWAQKAAAAAPPPRSASRNKIKPYSSTLHAREGKRPVSLRPALDTGTASILYASEIDFNLPEKYILEKISVIPGLPKILQSLMVRCFSEEQCVKWKRKRGEHKGQLLLRFSSPDSATRALRVLNGRPLGRGHIVVEPSHYNSLRPHRDGEEYGPRSGDDILNKCPPEPYPLPGPP